MKLQRFFLTVILLGLILSSISYAQIASDLRGRVFDPSGAVVANARVELLELSTGVSQTTVTSSSGDYLFIHLNPGSYDIDAGAPGFQNLHRTGITVILGQTVGVDLTLSV